MSLLSAVRTQFEKECGYTADDYKKYTITMRESVMFREANGDVVVRETFECIAPFLPKIMLFTVTATSPASTHVPRGPTNVRHSG